MNDPVPCSACAEPEAATQLIDGQCVSCATAERRESWGRPGYVSPDEVERRGDAISLAEQHSRHSVICGCNRRHR